MPSRMRATGNAPCFVCDAMSGADGWKAAARHTKVMLCHTVETRSLNRLALHRCALN